MAKKYIEAERLKGFMYTSLTGNDLYTPNRIDEFVDGLPVTDVVEVVRCGECTVPHNHWTGCPRMNGTIMMPDDYCSYGERKVTE